MGRPAVGSTKGLRVGIYARLSYNAKTGSPDEGLPIERQVEDCVETINRNGWQHAGTFVDDNISAWTGKHRPAWRDLLEACMDEERSIDVITAWRDDRLWRNVVEERQVSAMLAKHGVQLIAFASGRTYDPTDVDDQFTSGIHALVHEHESAVKAVRTRRAMRQRALVGRYLGGPVPFGYRRPTETELENGDVQLGGLVIVEDEAKVIQEMARRLLSGESAASIAHDLETREVPRGGSMWDHSRVRDVLANPLYAGLKSYRGEIVAQGRWDAILPRASYEALAAHFESQRRGPGRVPYHLLTGTLRCGKCGAKMKATSRRGHRYYACKVTRRTPNCGGVTIMSEPSEEWASERVLLLLADSEALAERLSSSESIDLSAVTEQLTAWERSREQLVEDHYLGKVPQGAYMKARERLDVAIEEARGTIRDAAVASQRDVPIGDLAALETWWESATRGQRRALIQAVVERIEVLPWEPRMGRRFSSDRLKIHWRY